MATSKPNFLIIVADDLGFSDPQPYGSEIKTPNLQWLADTGCRFTDFHTAPTCSPTRAMLMSGTDNHIAGLGAMMEMMRWSPDLYKDRKGYEGYLNFNVAALPEVMRDIGGYHTIMSGKWHLGLKKDVAPCSRGFDENFSFLAACGNHYNNEPQLSESWPRVPSINSDGLWMKGETFLDKKKDLPADFYSTRTFTDKMLDYLKQRSGSPDLSQKPFLAYLPFTAPHWPLQAPRDTIKQYEGVYSNGPEALRTNRLAALQRLKLVPEGVEPWPMTDKGSTRWKYLSQEERAGSQRAMEIYAAMVDLVDVNIGRVLDYLKSTGELDNTFILFMSDNGSEGSIMEAFPVLDGVSMADVVRDYCDNSLENMGNASSMVWYGPQWASASAAPSRGFKGSTAEGGIRCPCIVRYPPMIKDGGSICHAFTTVMDVMPTILDLAGVLHPAPSFSGRAVVPMRGKSWAPLFGDSTGTVEIHDAARDEYCGWELFGSRAVRKGSWKALKMRPSRGGTGDWELFNLDNDQGELHNIAHKHPEKLKELILHYETYFQETGVYDVEMVFQTADKRIAEMLGKTTDRGKFIYS